MDFAASAAYEPYDGVVNVVGNPSPTISGFPKPLPTRWSKRVPPQQPQVDDLIGREIRVRGGHAGIPSEATVNDDRRTKQPPPSVSFSAHIYLKLTVRSTRIRRHVYIEAACVYIHTDCVVTRLEVPKCHRSP